MVATFHVLILPFHFDRGRTRLIIIHVESFLCGTNGKLSASRRYDLQLGIFLPAIKTKHQGFIVAMHDINGVDMNDTLGNPELGELHLGLSLQ